MNFQLLNVFHFKSLRKILMADKDLMNCKELFINLAFKLELFKTQPNLNVAEKKFNPRNIASRITIP